jgi:hypothetical protein
LVLVLAVLVEPTLLGRQEKTAAEAVALLTVSLLRAALVDLWEVAVVLLERVQLQVVPVDYSQAAVALAHLPAQRPPAVATPAEAAAPLQLSQAARHPSLAPAAMATVVLSSISGAANEVRHHSSW